MWSYFEQMLQTLQEIPAYNNLKGGDLLAAVLHRPSYIWLRRRNRVEQAVSWAIACQTGVWAHKGEEKPRARAALKFDFKVIDEWCNRIAEHETAWANYFHENQIEPLVLFYEDVVACNRGAAERVLQFLELPFPPVMEIPPPAVEKQATRISEEWAACYLKLKRKKTSGLARIIRRIQI
jgi:trehalose 2-sulfotransferase